MTTDFPTTHEQLFELLFSSAGPAPNWWASLDGEVGKEGAGVYLQHALTKALGTEMGTAYRDRKQHPRHQHFFSTSVLSSMDGSFGNLAVEEKVTDLTPRNLLDGAISRGLVWTLGSPQPQFETPIALGLCVVNPKAKPISKEFAEPFFRVVHAIRSANVELVFVNSDGERWPRQPGGREPIPKWLSEVAVLDFWDLEAHTRQAVEWVVALSPTSSYYDYSGFPKPSGKPITECATGRWGNHWQMLDFGLLLRALGHKAVRVDYRGSTKLMMAGKGVEERVQASMRDKFGVVLDWGLEALKPALQHSSSTR